MELTTPALLFSTISLLLLAYTNRFLALATVIRGLAARQGERPDPIALEQITSLRSRIRLTQWMQGLGVGSLLGATLCMFSLFAGLEVVGRVIFGGSLLLMMGSLAISVVEIRISADALDIQLSALPVRTRD